MKVITETEEYAQKASKEYNKLLSGLNTIGCDEAQVWKVLYLLYVCAFEIIKVIYSKEK